ncbi:MAG: glycosyltransferase family 4 protein [Candidatus Omnitrophota bacterium]
MKIRVLHLIKTLNLGGAEFNLLNLALAANPDKVELYVGYSMGGELEAEFAKNKIKMFKFANAGHKIKSPVSALIIARIVKYILQNRIDIVHTHTFNAHIWGLLAAKLTRCKLVEHVHDFRYMESVDYLKRRGTSRQYRYIKYLKKASDAVIVLTDQNRDFLLKKGFYNKEQILRIPNGVPETKFLDSKMALRDKVRRKLCVKDDAFVIATACRLSSEKNIDLIFRIAPEVKKFLPNARFLIAGSGPLLENFQKESASQGGIRMLGFYPNIYELLACADIFLLPSFLELHSIALLQAMNMAVPVISSKGVGFNDSFIDNWENGVLLDPFIDNGWAETIVKILKAPELRYQLGQRGRQTCRQRFDISNEAENIEAIYYGLSKNK